MPQSISLEESNGYVNRMRKIIMSFPEVETVISQHGRPQDGTDATGFSTPNSLCRSNRSANGRLASTRTI